MKGTNQTQGRDMVFVSLEAWDEVWRRNQFLVAGFRKTGLTKRVLWVEPPRNLTLSLLGRLRGKKVTLPPAGIHAIGDVEGVFRYAPPQPLPNTLAPFRWINERVECWSLNRALRQMKMQRPLLWINNHWAAHVVGQLGESALIYDITDDWLVWERTPSRRQRLQRADTLLCERADATIVCSPQLLERKRDKARHLYLVPNGVDAQHYARIGAPDFAPHPQAANWKRPVLGYLGTIHPDRVDVELVVQLARAFPDATIALVGPNMLPSQEQARLESLSNVVMTEAVSYADVPAYLTAFDVALVPHVETPFTQSLNPIKLGEYLAAGLPIVSTRVAGFVELGDEHPDLVSAVSGSAAFIASCRAALRAGHPEHLCRARRALARDMSWEGRVDSVTDIITGMKR